MVSETDCLNFQQERKKGLNPCFGGIWSLSIKRLSHILASKNGLNPCFGGIWSLSCCNGSDSSDCQSGLNPCFGGIWSLSNLDNFATIREDVLILVLVGYGL